MTWQEWLDGLVSQTIQVAKEDIKSLIKDLEADADLAIKEQGAKLVTAMTLLSNGTITKEQFYGLVIDSRDLLMAGARVKTAEAKRRARDLAWRIGLETFGSLLAVL